MSEARNFLFIHISPLFSSSRLGEAAYMFYYTRKIHFVKYNFIKYHFFMFYFSTFHLLIFYLSAKISKRY